MQLRTELLAQRRRLHQRDLGCDVEFAGAIALEFGRNVVGRQILHVIDLRVRIIPVVRIAPQVDLRLYTPVVEPIRTIAAHAAGPREAADELCERRYIDRAAHRVCEQAETLRRLSFPQHLQSCRGPSTRRENPTRHTPTSSTLP